MEDVPRASRKLLAANMTLLAAITTTPVSPHECEVPKETNGRRLTAARERKLVDDFAFLAQTTDDGKKVMGVAVEEDADGKGLTIRLTSNAGNLKAVKSGFEKIAYTLQIAALKSNTREDSRRSLFHNIMILDADRILARLRSKHAPQSIKVRRKPTLIQQLVDVMNGMQSRTYAATNETLRGFNGKFRTIKSTFDSMEALPKKGCHNDSFIELLANLVEGFSELWQYLGHVDQQKELSMATAVVPADFENQIKALLAKVQKLARYWEISYDMTRAVRGSISCLFQRVRIRVLEPSGIDTSYLNTKPLPFEAVCPEEITDLERLEVLKARYEASVTAPVSNRKVHAEVKLLVFYEQNPSIPKPRVIGSSKSACYMCYMFFTIHGKFSVLRSHGVLYERWAAPEVSAPIAKRMKLNQTIMAMNVKLQKDICANFDIHAKQRTHPNESVVGLHSAWGSFSTLPSRIQPGTAKKTPSEDTGNNHRNSNNLRYPHIRSNSSEMARNGNSVSASLEPVYDGIRLSCVEIPCPDAAPNSSEDDKLLKCHSDAVVSLVPHKPEHVVEHGNVRYHLTSEDPEGGSVEVHCRIKRFFRIEGSSQNLTSKHIDIAELIPGEEQTVSMGAAYSPEELVLRYREAVLAVKYTYSTGLSD